jgi:hypothetical protein
LAGRALSEWQREMPKARERVLTFLELYEKWKMSPPTDEEYFKTVSSEGWVATPDNGFLFGDVYRVGAQMLMDIHTALGEATFYEVLGDAGKLIPTWRKAQERQ